MKHLLAKKDEVKMSWTVVYLPRGSPLAGTLKEIGMKRTQSLLLFEGMAPDPVGKRKQRD